MDRIRVLFLADSHLGFDLPTMPRVERRRRGHDFLANYARALEPAFNDEVDVVIHGGDVFDRPRVPPSLAYQAFQPLTEIAERGIPVFVVPGNHERSLLPHSRFAAHRNVFIFDRARSFQLEVRGMRITLAGFPYERNVRTRFPELLRATGWQAHSAAARLLCLHHCVEGATVGPGNFTFTSAKDVIRCSDLPHEFAAMLSGHIHRRQALTCDLRRRPLATPVLYPGSIERTSMAEADEVKGYIRMEIEPDANGGTARWQFCDLYARPMLVRELDVERQSAESLAALLTELIDRSPADAVLRIKLAGTPNEASRHVLSAARLRALAPITMNIEVA